MAEEALECPVCLTLPEGEVHQCNEGHCYCAECWNRLEDPRRCPECRQPVAQANRNRAAERAIAALEWSCEHCGEATTRGAKAAHLAACPQVPTACAAAAAGCGWAGVMSEQAAHEAACPFAICQRMMAPLQAECQQLRANSQELQSECKELRAQNKEMQQWSRTGHWRDRCNGLQAQNGRLQRQVAALQPLAHRVRVLEGDEEEGGRRQRQRVGAAAHDAPPSDAAVAVMGLAEAVAALRAHVADARVAEAGCRRVEQLCVQAGNNQNSRRKPDRLAKLLEQASAEAGPIEAVVEAMRAHPLELDVQVQGMRMLYHVCVDFGGYDEPTASVLARQRRALRAGGRTLANNAWLAFEQATNIRAGLPYDPAEFGAAAQDYGPMARMVLDRMLYENEVSEHRTLAQDLGGFLGGNDHWHLLDDVVPLH